MNGQLPTAAAKPLTEAAVSSEQVDKYLQDYVKPAFLKMSDDQRTKAVEMLNKMTSEE